jgi:hypothetical protein
VTRIVAAIALTLGLAAPAAADTVAHRTPAVGPALAGDLVAWGEEAHNGAVRVVVGAPGREPMLAYRVAPATARRTERGFQRTAAAFAASATGFAAVVHTATVTHEEFDNVSTAIANAAVGGPFRGPPALLSGSIPRRADGRCRGELQHPQAVDIDGDNIAVGDFASTCGSGAPWQARVVLSGPGVHATLETGTGGFMRDVAIAGRYLGWVHSGDRDELVVRNLDTGDTVLRLTARDLHATHIDELALQADGTVAISYGGLTGQRLGWSAPGLPGVRLLDRRNGPRGLALAAGRVLYERVVSERRFTGELVLRPLAGGPERRLARFPERRRRVGDLDLDATRATWADQPTRRGYDPVARGTARIVVRTL